MELFDLLLRIGPLAFHMGMAIEPPESRPPQLPEGEHGPMPHLPPVDAPLAVVIDDDGDPDLLRERIGFR